MNLNRLREGLRVIEEAARFILNDAELTENLKKLRHTYGHLKMMIPEDTMSSRDIDSDIGKPSEFDISESKNITDIVGKSFGRSQEAARVIEEYSKMINNDIGKIAKSIRFQLYQLEKDMMPALKSKIVFPDKFGLYLVMTNPIIGYEKLTEIAVKCNVRVIQLRDKEMDDKDLLKTAIAIKKITNGSNTLFFVNDRPDIAIMSKADGVHLGQTDLPIKECRCLSDKLFIGKSTHTLKQMKDALKEKPDYIGIGPIYKTKSKKLPDNVLGLDKSMEMLKGSNVPSIGIGGIKDFNLKEVIEIGFNNIGIISYITKSSEPKKQIEETKNIFRSYYDTEN